MSGFAQVQLLGNVGRNPEMSYTQDGSACTKFSVAVSEKTKKGGEQTTWYNCTSWGPLAEMLNTHLTKGSSVFVQGRLAPRSYTTKDGKSGTSLDVTVEKFSFAGGKSAGQKSDNASNDDLGELDDHPF